MQRLADFHSNVGLSNKKKYNHNLYTEGCSEQSSVLE